MKYLNALLQGEEIPRTPREEEPAKPAKGLLMVLQGGSGRSLGETASSFLPSLPALSGRASQERQGESEAVTWLHSRLTPGPYRIADLFFNWCADVVGHSSQEISARVDLLNNARWTLGVEAYVGTDDRLWWRLPHETVQ